MDNNISGLFRGHSVRKLRAMMDVVDKRCAAMSEEEIWRRDREGANSIGNLLLHLEGNLGQFIGHYLEGKPDVRVRPREFETLGGIDRDTLLAALRARVEAACLYLAEVSDEVLLRTVTTMNGEMSGLDVVYQVVGHFQLHAGQIIWAAKTR